MCSFIPSGTSSLCDRFLKVFLRMPKLLCDFFSWAFNEDGTISDEFKNEMQVIPTGTVIARLSTVAPTGFLKCDGSEVSRETYALLFSLLGTTYGAGNGTTTFNLPNFQDRFLYGKGSTSAIGDTGGEAEHTLTMAELPSGQMPVDAENQPTGRFANYGAAVTPKGFAQGDPDPLTVPIGGAYLDLPGSDAPHNNLPPFAVVVWYIKF